MQPEDAIYFAWFLWFLSWVAAAVWSGRTMRRPAFGSEFSYRILEVGGFVLLLGVYRRGVGDLQSPLHHVQTLWTLTSDAAWLMLGLAIAGFLFSWWARVHLGRLWSGAITRKEGHRVVDTGPYSLVRHPIYTGILLAAAATMIDKGSELAVIGFGLLLSGFWLKARLEERFLRAELGAQEYDAYARKTAMLIPFVRI